VSRPRPDYSWARAITRTELEWGRLLSLAAAHGVRPHLISALVELDWAGVPSNVKQSLVEFSQLHKARSLFVAGQLIEAADQLSRRSIRFATFKGPALAAAVYGDLSRRECNDIDIIVDDHQIPEAEAVLSALGYKSVYSSAAFRRTFLSYQGQIMLVGKNHDLAIDLHWDFATRGVPFPISRAEIWSNLEKLEIGGQTVPALGRNDLALYLAGHGTKEGWSCLGWVSDFAFVIERYPDLDWARLLNRARNKGCGRSLFLGCELAAQLLDTRVKGDFPKPAKSSEDPKSTAESIVRRLRTEFPAASSERLFGDLNLCETRRQKARAIGRLIITRTAGDYSSKPLAESLWRVYYVTRPFRLAGKFLANAAQASWTIVRRKCSNWSMGTARQYRSRPRSTHLGHQ
jgi:hypothetical protein